MTDRFLVTGANGDIADAIGRILAEAYPAADRIGTDLAEAGDWPGRQIFSAIHSLPRGDAPDYLEALRQLIAHTRSTLVIPTSEAELRTLAARFEQVKDLPLLMNSPEVILRFLDKLETARWLESIGVSVPRTLPLKEARAADLPLIVKPRFGRGSRGVETVRNADRLEVVQAERTDPTVAQTLLGDENSEYTCALFRWDNTLRTLVMRRRLIGGLTSRIIVERHEAIDVMLETIAAKLPSCAAVNVQLRLTKQGPRIFEINPRLSGTVMMRHRAGLKDLIWWIEARRGSVPPMYVPPEGLMVYRTYGEVVVERLGS